MANGQTHVCSSQLSLSVCGCACIIWGNKSVFSNIVGIKIHLGGGQKTRPYNRNHYISVMSLWWGCGGVSVGVGVT